MLLPVGPYTQVSAGWPSEGRHILATHDAETIVVYQAYRPAIARYAIEHGRFGGEFSFGRMSWIKPNFLWMMHRSGWGTKPDQEMILGVRLPREFFDRVLANAVPSSFHPGEYATEEEWKSAVLQSDIRIQWDPDHAPDGTPVERRAIQLGLRDELLREYGTQAIREVIDMSSFVAEQRARLEQHDEASLLVPSETPYVPADVTIRKRIGLAEAASASPSQRCPICQAKVDPSPRYPRYLCRSCAGRAVSPAGRPLRFYNEGMSGGFLALHADDGSTYPSHDCVVQGVPCRAEEAKFGGIVIQPKDSKPV